MKFYSTNNNNQQISLKEAVLQGLAPDNGLYMPLTIPKLPFSFFHDLSKKSFRELSFDVAANLIGEDLPSAELKKFQSLHYAEYPGALLAGVNGIVIKCHGYSTPRAFTNGILGAIELIKRNKTNN